MDSGAQEAIAEVEDRGRTSLRELIVAIEAAGLEESSLGDAYKGRRGADVIGHLHGWHDLFVRWSRAHHAGETVFVPAEGHSWDRLDDLNDELYERWADTTWEQICLLAIASREAMFVELKTFTPHEIMVAGAVGWSPSMSLLQLADECAALHDNWARERLAEAKDQIA